MPRTVRIVCLSDTHTKHGQVDVPFGDILIHAGDFTNVGKVEEIASFNAWLGTLPHRHKVIIAGNHELLFESQPALAASLITNAIYLRDSTAVIEGLKFYGTPWQPWFMEWAFGVERGPRIREKWQLIPEDVDVLITHGPPQGVQDLIPNGKRIGCEELRARVFEVRPRLHVFGHIHEGYGVTQSGGIIFVNAATCDERYKPVNRPLIINLNVP